MKKLCKEAKGDFLDKNMDEYVKAVTDPTHVCTKCGRVSNDKNLLCKSIKLADIESEKKDKKKKKKDKKKKEKKKDKKKEQSSEE